MRYPRLVVLLDELLTPALAQWLESLDEPSAFLGLPELDECLDRWGQGRATVTTVGHSSGGRPIRVASFGDGGRSMLAWGYPHPDEPLGAESLVRLGDRLDEGPLDDLAEWTVHLILCADPDQFLRQRWLRATGAREFSRGTWRPTHIGLEIDYGFPLDWGPFLQRPDAPGRCRSQSECREICGLGGCRHEGYPFPPLPESLALAEAIDRFRPELAASMHCTHTGGDYTFLLRRERRETLEAMTAIPDAAGTGRHLGEPIDRGRRWRRDAPDLIHECGLDCAQKSIERRPWYDDRFVYPGNHSAARYLEARVPGAQFICPESTQYRHPDFSCTDQLDETVQVLMSVEDRPRAGRCRVVRIDVDGEWVIAQQERSECLRRRKPYLREVPVTRAMLGVAALQRRRQTLAAADKLWAEIEQLGNLVEHPYRDERAALTVPGAYVNDRSMRIFRIRSDYRRPATVAQAASFRYLWPMHTATLLGNMQNYLAAQDQQRPEIAAIQRRLDQLQEEQLEGLPRQLLAEADRAPAMRSILGRCLLLML